MMRPILKIAGCVLCLCGVGFLPSIAVLHYLNTVEARVHGLTGCYMQAGSRHLHVGAGTLERVFENVTLRCARGNYGLMEADIRHASLMLSIWHPFSVTLVVQGGAKIENVSALPRRVLVQAEGAPLSVRLPLWLSRPVSAVTFASEALRLSAWQGAGQKQAVYLQTVQGTLMWNPQAQTQSSVMALTVSARGMGSTFWKENVANVTLAMAVPGPAQERHALWAALAGQPDVRGDAALQASSAATPDVLVQHAGAVWRGVSVAWSARLWFLPSEGLVGESWLTLPDWRAALEAVQAEKYLTPEQQEALHAFQEKLVQRHALMEGPLKVPLAVRGGQLVIGPCRMSVQSLNCSGLF